MLDGKFKLMLIPPATWLFVVILADDVKKKKKKSTIKSVQMSVMSSLMLTNHICSFFAQKLILEQNAACYQRNLSQIQ